MYQFCPNCFSDAQEDICPFCGYDQSNTETFNGTVIPPMNILKGRYILGRVLGRGGFGVTYIAKDLVESRLVAIKEYMPECYAQRVGELMVYPSTDETVDPFYYCLNNFRTEMNVLSELRDNDFVVNVYESFAENNTEYIVMEYIDGVTIKTLTYRNAVTLSENEAIFTILVVGSALMEVHKKGIIHRDISPENIMMTSTGEIKLIDFGAATNFNNWNARKNDSIFLKPGFTPPEQYSQNTIQGPWTDIYALGATLYSMLTTNPLVPSDERQKNDTLVSLRYANNTVSTVVSDAVEKAMKLIYTERYQVVNDFLNELAGAMSNTPETEGVQIAPQTIAMVRHKRQFVEESHLRPYVIINTPQGRAGMVCIPTGQYLSAGRDPHNVDIYIDGGYAGVGRLHCYIGYEKSTNEFIVVDNDSVNGTFLYNSMQLEPNTPCRIKPGMSIYLSDKSISLTMKLM